MSEHAPAPAPLNGSGGDAETVRALLKAVKRALGAGGEEALEEASRALARVGSAASGGAPGRAAGVIDFRFPTAEEASASPRADGGGEAQGAVRVSLAEINEGDGEGHEEGCVVWTAAVALAMLTSLGRVRVGGESVLELGAGCGINGLVCAKVGARSVTLTEIDDSRILGNLEANVARNADALGACAVSVRALDWRDPRGVAGRYSRILAADCILGAYDSPTLLPRVLSRFLAGGGLAHLSMRVRGAGSERTLDAFLENLREPSLALRLVSVAELSSAELAEAEACVLGAECCDSWQDALSSERFFRSGVCLITVRKEGMGGRCASGDLGVR